MVVELTDDPIDVQSMIEKTRNTEAGAVVTFQGTVRRFSDELEVVSLTYESYREMAISTIEKIVQEAKSKFDVIDIYVVHRLGNIKLKEDSVAICVSSAHRKDGFRACEFVIDELKTKAPIWKKDITPQGNEKWRN